MSPQTLAVVAVCSILAAVALVYLIHEGGRVIDAAEAELDTHDDEHGCGCPVCCDCPDCTAAMDLVRARIRETLRRELIAREDLREINTAWSLPSYTRGRTDA